MTLAVSRLSFTSRALLAPDPPNERIRRILNALRSGRIMDTDGLKQELSQDSQFDSAWKNYLSARLHLEKGDFALAKSRAQLAASESLSRGLSGSTKSDALRLAAAAMETEGISLRRQDQPLEAKRMHLAAYVLRQEIGTPDEQAESAMSLGICAGCSGDFATAERWFRIAANVGVVGIDQARLKASALIRLSASLGRLQRHDEATQSAQAAQYLLDEFIPGDITAIAAGLHTAQAMIRHTEKLLGEHPVSACLLLDEASQLLQITHENLSGFGSPAQAELAWCDEQIDFVERLRETVGLNTIPHKPA